MKKLLIATLASISLASAGTLTFDDFSTDQALINISGSSTVGPRTITLNDLGGAGTIQHTVEVAGGILDVTNGTGDDSEVVVLWDVPAALAIPVGSTNVQITLVVIQSDGNPTDLSLSGIASGNFAIPGGINVPTPVAFNVAGPPVGPGSLTLKLNGAPGWDLAIDSVGFSWTDPVTTAVPEPATFGFIGLGLVAVPFLRRKR